MRKIGQGIFLFLTVFIVSCGQGNGGNGNAPGKTVSEIKGLGISSKKVWTIGYYVGGLPTTDWALYEEYFYNEQGNEVERILHWDGFGTRILTEYDDQGRKKTEKRISNDRMGNVDYTFRWSPDGRRVTEEEYIHREERMIKRTMTSYDGNGNVLGIREEDYLMKDFEPASYSRNFTYDEQGRLLQIDETLPDGKVIVGTKNYYADGKDPIRTEQFDNSGYKTRTLFFEYDEKGNVLSQSYKDDWIKDPYLEKSYAYDEAGRLISEKKYNGICDETGRKENKCNVVTEIIYNYNKDGLEIYSEQKNSLGQVNEMKKKTEYTYF